MNDRIVSALIGLSGACRNNGKTENTDAVVIRALSSCMNDTETDAAVSEIRREKYEISPNCATCPAPCGNTSDYDMSDFYSDSALSSAKERLLYEAASLASRINASGKTALPDSVYRAISFIGYETNISACLELAEILNKTEVNHVTTDNKD